MPSNVEGSSSKRGASVVVRVEWADTDGSGFHHNSFVIRLFEAAEVALHKKLGLGTSLFGKIPRVRSLFVFKRRLAFGDLVEARVAVASIGRTSLTYTFEARRRGEVVAEGEVIVVHAAPESEHGEAWPEDVRNAFSADLTRSRTSRREPRLCGLPCGWEQRGALGSDGGSD